MSYDSKEYYERFRSSTLVEHGKEILPIQMGVDNDTSVENEDRSPVGKLYCTYVSFKLIQHGD